MTTWVNFVLISEAAHAAGSGRARTYIHCICTGIDVFDVYIASVIMYIRHDRSSYTTEVRNSIIILIIWMFHPPLYLILFPFENAVSIGIR